MRCEGAQDLLTGYVLGDLDNRTRRAVRDHLKECERCRAAVRELEPTLDLLRDALGAPAVAPARLPASHRARIMQAEPRRSGTLLRWLYTEHPALAWAASLVVSVGFFWMLFGELRSDTAVRRKTTGHTVRSEEEGHPRVDELADGRHDVPDEEEHVAAGEKVAKAVEAKKDKEGPDSRLSDEAMGVTAEAPKPIAVGALEAEPRPALRSRVLTRAQTSAIAVPQKEAGAGGGTAARPTHSVATDVFREQASPAEGGAARPDTWPPRGPRAAVATEALTTSRETAPVFVRVYGNLPRRWAEALGAVYGKPDKREAGWLGKSVGAEHQEKAKAVWVEAGVEWPPRSWLRYDPENGQLTVANTRTNLDIIGRMLEEDGAEADEGR